MQLFNASASAGYLRPGCWATLARWASLAHAGLSRCGGERLLHGSDLLIQPAKVLSREKYETKNERLNERREISLSPVARDLYPPPCEWQGPASQDMVIATAWAAQPT